MGLIRTRSPPSATEITFSVASRPSARCWAPTCTASSAHSSVTTSVSRDAVGQHDLQVVGQRAGPDVREHDGRLGVRAGAQLQVRGGRGARARARHRDRQRRGGAVQRHDRDVGAADQACAATRSAGTPPSPTRASPRSTRSTVTPSPAPAISTTAVPSRRRRPVVQPAQPAQRGEPPVLLAAARDLERLDVVGREALPRRRDGRLPWPSLAPLQLGSETRSTFGGSLIRPRPPSAAR